MNDISNQRKVVKGPDKIRAIFVFVGVMICNHAIY